MQTRYWAVAVCAALLTTGCVSTTYYVEEGHTHADLQDVHQRVPPTLVHVSVEFLRNGAHYAEGDGPLNAEVRSILLDSHVLYPVFSNAPLDLHVVLDDHFDPGAARSAGTLSGVTQGFVGNHIRDEYAFSISLHGQGMQPRIGSYCHAIETVVGRATPDSSGLARSKPDEAFQIVVKQAVLDFLVDMQAVGDADEAIMMVPDESTTKHSHGVCHPPEELKSSR